MVARVTEARRKAGGFVFVMRFYFFSASIG
jgi:hypothetical protein